MYGIKISEHVVKGYSAEDAKLIEQLKYEVSTLMNTKCACRLFETFEDAVTVAHWILEKSLSVLRPESLGAPCSLLLDVLGDPKWLSEEYTPTIYAAPKNGLRKPVITCKITQCRLVNVPLYVEARNPQLGTLHFGFESKSQMQGVIARLSKDEVHNTSTVWVLAREGVTLFSYYGSSGGDDIVWLTALDELVK